MRALALQTLALAKSCSALYAGVRLHWRAMSSGPSGYGRSCEPGSKGPVDVAAAQKRCSRPLQRGFSKMQKLYHAPVSRQEGQY